MKWQTREHNQVCNPAADTFLRVMFSNPETAEIHIRRYLACLLNAWKLFINSEKGFQLVFSQSTYCCSNNAIL